MPVRSSFTAGEVLTAADLTDTFGAKVDYALTANAQSGTGASAYTFVLADASRLTTATGTSAKTFTIPPQANVAWVANSIIRVANYGAGALTIAGGSGVTVTNASTTLAQYESAALVRTGSNAWTLIPFSGGAGNADFSNTASGTYSDAGINYKWIQFTASGTLTVTRAGFADVLVVGAGGSGGGSGGGGGGAGDVRYLTNVYLGATTHTVTVGGGGSGTTGKGVVGSGSRLGDITALSGGGGGSRGAQPEGHRQGDTGASGGGDGRDAGSASARGLSLMDGVVGHRGGSQTQTSFGGGGGGGGRGGQGGDTTSATGGNGGSGINNSITGSSVGYGGGGGGGSDNAGGSASSGGGAGASGAANGTSGTVNRGGGGGGAGGTAGTSGGNGGSGIVIVRVRTN